MRYYSPSDEAAFFGWLQSIPGVIRVHGQGRELVIELRSKRLSASSLRELIALYRRYEGNMSELAQFANYSPMHSSGAKATDNDEAFAAFSP